MRKSGTLPVRALSAAVSAVLLCVAWSSVALCGDAAAGGKAPPFSARDLKGETQALEALLAGHGAVVLNFWGLRCGACIQEIPHLNAMAKRYAGKAAFLGVNVDGVDAAYILEQMKRGGLVVEYPVLPDPEFKLVDAYKMIAAPLTVVIDGSATERFRHENFEPGDEKKLEEALAKVLGGR